MENVINLQRKTSRRTSRQTIVTTIDNTSIDERTKERKVREWTKISLIGARSKADVTNVFGARLQELMAGRWRIWTGTEFHYFAVQSLTIQ